MKIIVTGGTGYIGSHTVVELQQDGLEVVILDNLVNSNIEVLDGIEGITGIRPAFEKIDLTDRPATLDFFARHRDAKMFCLSRSRLLVMKQSLLMETRR